MKTPHRAKFASSWLIEPGNDNMCGGYWKLMEDARSADLELELRLQLERLKLQRPSKRWRYLESWANNWHGYKSIDRTIDRCWGLCYDANATCCEVRVYLEDTL